MSRRLLLALLAVLLGVTPAVAQVSHTFPGDAAGTPGPSCSTFTPYGNSSGAPTFCSQTNPLPVATVTPGSTSPGNQWFGNNQTAPNRSIAAIFIGPNDLVGIAPSTLHTAVSWTSSNGGQLFVQQATNDPTLNTNGASNNDFSNGLILTTAGYAAASACTNGGSACSPYYTLGPDLQVATLSTQTGLAATVGNPELQAWEIEQQGTTLLSFTINKAGGNIAGSPFVCTSSANAATPGGAWACTALSGTFGALQPSAGQQIASPGTITGGTANVWIVLAMSGTNKQLFRSTDNGVTWTSVFTFTSAPNNNSGAVLCLSSTTCVATDGAHIAQTTNQGSTWTQVATGGSGLTGFVNFGGGNVEAICDTNQSAACAFFVTSNFGGAWFPGPVFKFSTAAIGAAGVMQISSFAFNAVYALQSTGNGSASNAFTFLPPSPTQIVGPNGSAVAGPAGTPGTQALTVQGITGGTPLVTTLSGASTQNVTAAEGTGVANSGNTQPWAVMVLAPGNCTFTGCQLIQQTTTSAANTAQTINIPTPANLHGWVFEVAASCSAGTATLTITDNNGTIWSVAPATIGATTTSKQFLPFGIENRVANMNVNVGACGVGNTSTVFVNAAVF